MNKKQKILTFVFLALFIATLVWFPWICRFDIRDQMGAAMPGPGLVELKYSFFLKPPSEFSWTDNTSSASRPAWTKVGLEWFALGVIYAALFFALKRED